MPSREPNRAAVVFGVVLAGLLVAPFGPAAVRAADKPVADKPAVDKPAGAKPAVPPSVARPAPAPVLPPGAAPAAALPAESPGGTVQGGAVRGDSDPTVASVDGHPIHLSELGRASETLPENLRELPFETLYPVLLERMIDHQALVMMARRQGLEDNAVVKREIEAAVERVLESAYLNREALSKITDKAIQARYNQEFGNRPATEEVRARHILLATEAEANDVLGELRNGADSQ